MLRYLFKNKWMYFWLPFAAVSVYGGGSILPTVAQLILVWCILDTLDTYEEV
jgi:hypothetical protein